MGLQWLTKLLITEGKRTLHQIQPISHPMRFSVIEQEGYHFWHQSISYCTSFTPIEDNGTLVLCPDKTHLGRWSSICVENSTRFFLHNYSKEILEICHFWTDIRGAWKLQASRKHPITSKFIAGATQPNQ